MKIVPQKCKPYDCPLITLLPVGIFHADMEGHYFSVNDRWCEMTGVTAVESQGEGWAQALHPTDKEHVFAKWYQAVQEHLPFQAEYRLQRPDGKITWVLAQAVAETDNSGTVTGYVGTVTDISEYKRIETELLQANERFQLAAAAVNFTIYDWDIAKKSVYRTEGLINLLGYRSQEAEPTQEWWFDRIHP